MLDSHYLSYLLRHYPEKKGLTLDEYGWCNVQELLKALHITMEELDYCVTHNTRYIYSEDKQFIKAAHGHSIPIKYTNEKEPPEYLYHGTAEAFVKNIMKVGLKKLHREAVHLSEDPDVALKVGSRHAGGNLSKTAILEIKAQEMFKDGFKFYCSEDKVWLVNSVPPKY